MGFEKSYYNITKKVNDLFWGTKAFYIPFILATIIGLGAVISSCIFNKKQREYEERVQGVCSRVERKFDSNNNGMIEPDEAVKLERAVGYDRMGFPVARLEPGSYSEKDIKLILSGSGSYAWNEEFRFPESRLWLLSKQE